MSRIASSTESSLSQNRRVESSLLVEAVEVAVHKIGVEASVATCTTWESTWDIDTTLSTLELDFNLFTGELSAPATDDVRWRRGLLAGAKAARRLGRPIGHRSRSHTRGLSIAIAIPRTKFVVGIGIDIEPAGRAISNKLSSKLRQKYGAFPGTDIELWCALEAVFKADPVQAPTGLFSYRFENGRFFKDEFEFPHVTLVQHGHAVAVAICQALRSS